jgi:uncharacterized LabA/DUF88 family protein
MVATTNPMYRFVTFVDGSNLAATLRRMSLRIDNYEPLYRHIFENATKAWRTTFDGPGAAAQLHRVKWYEVGSLDEWNLDDAKAQLVLRDIFERDADLKRFYLALAAQKNPNRSRADLAHDAWSLCFTDVRRWYEERRDLVDGFRRFHYAIRSATGFIDLVECGHWKLDLIRRQVLEKGLDTRLAVDLVTLIDTYEVALLVPGDTEIPSIEHVQARGRHVGVVEFIAGNGRERRPEKGLSRVRVAADFVVQVHEADLLKAGIVKKTTGPTGATQAAASRISGQGQIPS